MDTGLRNGGRWYDSTRVIWGLFSVVGFLLGVGLTTLWTQITDHEARIRALEITTAQHAATYGEIARRLERIETKVDKLQSGGN